MYNIKYENYKECLIEIDKKDYDNVVDNKTIYEIKIVDSKGINKIKKIISLYKYIIIFVLLSFSAIYFLSHLIFDIDIITNDKRMKNDILLFLKSNGISKYHFKKNYRDIQKIKDRLLNNYKNKIDWIEIENIGSKYIVRFEPRISNETENKENYQNIIAKKDAVIYSIDVSAGEIKKKKFDYVKKGDVIVSGYIYLNEEIKDTKSSTGKVYGEVWYKVTVKELLNKKITNKTGNSKSFLNITFLNKEINLLNFEKYKNSISKKKMLVKNNLLPISLNIKKEEELNIKVINKTVKEATKNAIKSAKEKIKNNLKDGEYIKDYKVLNRKKNKNDVEVEIFFSVIENITEYQQIQKYEKENEKINE